MMKKLVFVIMLVCLLCSACGRKKPEETTAATTTEATTTAITSHALTYEQTTTETTTVATTTTEATTVATTEPELIHGTVEGTLGSYRMAIIDAADEADAAAQLCAKMLDAMKTADSSRSFCITEYTSLIVDVHPSSVALDQTKDWGVPAGSPLIAGNIWFVYPDATFRFTGTYEELGESDGDAWYSGLNPGDPSPLVLMKTDAEYILWWGSSEESRPVEFYQNGK